MQYTQGYIWQRDRFQLVSTADQEPPWHIAPQVKSSVISTAMLWGSLCFGDNIDDEWFISWLLLDITRHYNGVTAR